MFLNPPIGVRGIHTSIGCLWRGSRRSAAVPLTTFSAAGGRIERLNVKGYYRRDDERHFFQHFPAGVAFNPDFDIFFHFYLPSVYILFLEYYLASVIFLESVNPLERM